MKNKIKIELVTLSEVRKAFKEHKPDLIDKSATYIGAWIENKLIGIVSYVEREYTIYLCHSFVLPPYRKLGVYKLLIAYRDLDLETKHKGKTAIAHCNSNSFKSMTKIGYNPEYLLIKVSKTI